MMKYIFILLGVVSLLTACGVDLVHLVAEKTPTPLTSEPEATPTYPGTWEAVIEGVIYDQSTGEGQPIVDATITYDVLHSYFPELQEGRLNKTISDENGFFSLEVMVHDTDSIRILVEAQGFLLYEERFSGVDLVAGKNLEVELIPLE